MKDFGLSLISVASLFSVVGLMSACGQSADPCEEGDQCSADADADAMNAAYEDATTDAKEDTYDCSGVRVPDRTGFNKRVALTFDDGQTRRPRRR